MSKQIYSDYLVFVDESGSPHMGGEIDPQYPLFVLAFLIVKKSDYIEKVCPALQKFKFKHFGHDHVILHEREIRKNLDDFIFLMKSPAIKTAFLNELTDIIEQMPIHISVAIVDKTKHREKHDEPVDPYHLGLLFGFERIINFLIDVDLMRGLSSVLTHVIVESRGKREDKDLELAFRRICNSRNFGGERNILEIIFADKKSNSAGLQLADLIARPAGMSILRAQQENRAMKTIMKKLLHRDGKIDGWGLKCFP